MIAIVDYGSGNISAIANIYKQLKEPHLITSDPAALADADRYLLPGVGAFDTVMDDLTRSGMLAALQEQVLGKRKKVLGICIGMQILAHSSEEGVKPGVGWIEGRIRKIDRSTLGNKPMLPHMGWNSVSSRQNAPLFEGVDTQRGFYFLHSYYFDAASAADVVATVDYGTSLPCAINHDNVYGMQFHPEKSHDNGVMVLRNFARL